MDHFASLIAADSFLSLGHGEHYTISRLENLLLRTASGLVPEQACRSYSRIVKLNQLLTAKVILPNPLSNESLQIMNRVNSIQLRQEDQAMGWNVEFISLVSALMSAIEQCLIRQCARAMRCSSWQRMDADLRMKMQKLACLTDSEDLRKLRSSTSSIGSIRNYSASSSVSSRTNDLRQVKLAIQAHSRKIHGGPVPPIESSNIPIIKKTVVKSAHPVTKSSTKTNVPEKPNLIHKRSQSEEVSGSKGKLNVIKSRYMEPRKLKTPEKANSRLQLKVKNISSSESSRGSSPAFNCRQNIGVRKASNLSIDSLQQQKTKVSKPKSDNMELSIDSLASMKSSMKTISSESLVKRGHNLTDETKLMKCDSRGKIPDHKNTKQFSHQNSQIRRSFLSQKSREILAKRNQVDRKHSTNSNSSVTNNSSPKLNDINKSSSSASLESKKKVFNTTLHLRKTATLEPDLKKNPVSKIMNGKPANAKTRPASATKKTETAKKVEKKPVYQAPLAKEEEVEIALKMARSNTFSKETPDNPLELLQIIN